RRGEGGLDYRLVAFEPQLPRLFRAASLAISRAGASTVAELSIIGTPSVLVPLPNAPADHQRRNTAELVRAGGALVVEDDDATAERFAEILERLLKEPERLEQMASGAASVARRDGTERIVRLIEEVGHFQRRAA